MSEKPIFQVTDIELPDGLDIDFDAYDYKAYFENKQGEHIIFMYDQDDGKGQVTTSQDNWEETTEISEGEIQNGDFHLHFGLFEGESSWFQAITLALQARKKIEQRS